MRQAIEAGAAVVIAAVLLAAMAVEPAIAQTAEAPSLSAVIDAIRRWMVGLLTALATLCLTVGGLRYMTASGDPAQVERAKTTLKSAAAGYILAALAPMMVEILRSIVGA